MPSVACVLYLAAPVFLDFEVNQCAEMRREPLVRPFLIRGAAKSGVETLTPWAAVQGSADILLRRYGAASRVAGRSR